MVQEVNPKPTKAKARKFAGSLAALSAAAVVSIYTVGYASTQSSIDDLTAQVSAASVVTPPTNSTTSGSAAPSTSTILPTPTATSGRSNTSGATVSAYVDGTYTGTGNSRHGSITATVVISGGKVTSASITSCATRYPCSDVDSLVKEAVAKQAVPTSNVSGATDSSRAYKTAVTTALQKAATGV